MHQDEFQLDVFAQVSLQHSCRPETSTWFSKTMVCSRRSKRREV